MIDVLDEQKTFFDFIRKEIIDNKVSHAYLIETNGYKNIDSVVKEFTKLLLCKNRTENCNDCHCNVCQLIDAGLYPDIKIIQNEGSYIKKEQLLVVKDEFRNKSMYGNKQIYIISDASKLNGSSANTMLKFLEEPEDNIIAILLVDNRYKVLDTILSRCQVHSLISNTHLYFDDDIVEIAKNIFSIDKGFLVYDYLLKKIPDRKCAYDKLKAIQRLLFNNFKGQSEKIIDIADKKMIYFIDILESTINKLEYNVNYKLVLDDMLINIREVYNESC